MICFVLFMFNKKYLLNKQLNINSDSYLLIIENIYNFYDNIQPNINKAVRVLQTNITAIIFTSTQITNYKHVFFSHTHT